MAQPADSMARTVVLPSACPLDCPDSCSLDITVEDGRVTKIEGADRNPVTAGFICSKVRHFHRHLYCDERLLTPARRRGPKGAGEFEPVSWDAALDLVEERFRQTLARHGAEAILPFSYGGSNGFLSQDTTDARLFYRLGTSRLARTVCAATTGRAAYGLYGRITGVAYEDYVESKLIVVWGANPSVSSIHMVPIVQEAQRRGAKLVVIDPREIPLAKKADIHLALRPGTDLPVALAVIRWLFENGAADLDFLAAHANGSDELRQRAKPWTIERAAAEAGLEAADLEAFARLFASSSPAVVRCGWGPERNRNGGSAIAAILALPAVGGKFGVRGGGFTMSNSNAWSFDADDRIVGAPEPATRELNMNRLGADLLELDDPPIEVLFVYNANPLATLPDQEKVRAGLSREDLFTVVFDSVLTDTARYADLVLPATTFLERRELQRGYGAMPLHDLRPVIAPVGESRPNHEVFAELCRRFDLTRDGELDDAEEMIEALLASTGRGAELRRELDDKGIAYSYDAAPPLPVTEARPLTASGKIELCPADLDEEAPAGLYAYSDDPASERFPLALISPATHHTISSILGQLQKDQVAVELHPQDAASRGIDSGDTVRIWNELGEVRCRARLSKDQRPGVAFLPKGIWCHNTLNGNTSNAVVPATFSDLAGGACFNDARVQIEKAA